MTQTEMQTELSKEKSVIYADEIELIGIFRVIWKWKYLIIVGTSVCVLAAVIVNFNLQTIYQVNMVLKSGINKVGSDGEPAYLDSVEDFKTLIEGEILFKLLDLSKSKGRVVSSEAFRITADNRINTLRILHESTDKEEGIKNLNYLSNMLSERYENRLLYLQDGYEYKLLIAKRQLEFGIDVENFITSKLIDIQKRLDSYNEDIGPINDSSESRAKNQKTLLDYAYIVEKVADLKRRHALVSSQIAAYKKQMADLEKERISKQAIVVAQTPTASQLSVKPKKMRNMMLATIIGLFGMLFLSFFLEYKSRNKGSKTSVNAQLDK